MGEDLMPGDDAVHEAARGGYLKGLNLGLLTVAIPTAVLAAARPFADVPRYENFFKGIKVPLPVLTLMVVEHYQSFAFALVVGVIGCCVATRIWGHRRKTVVLNGILLFAALSWLTLLVEALHLPMMSLLGGLGSRGF